MVKVLDIPFYDQSIPVLVPQLVADCLSSPPQNRCISASGAHGLVEAHQNPAFKTVLESFYLNLPDGMPGVWVGRWKGAKAMQRCYGPDFFKAFLTASAPTPINHFFCGGKPGIAEMLKENVSQRWGNNRVVGVYAPPFRAMTQAEMQELATKIDAAKAQVVWIGLSTPKQEQFAWQLAQLTRVHYIVAVGAAFDFHTDQIQQAPRWMQQMGLEWFFRLLVEPKRLFKRYVVVVPAFMWLNLKEFLGRNKKTSFEP